MESAQLPCIQFMYDVSLASTSGLKKFRFCTNCPVNVSGKVNTCESSLRTEN